MMPSVLELAVFGLELTCGKCGRTVPYEQFVPNEGICKDCRSARKREWYARRKKKGEKK